MPRLQSFLCGLGLLFLLAPPAARSATITFQEGVSGYAGTQDTFLSWAGAFESANWGQRGNLYVGPYSGDTPDDLARTLIRFDVSALAGLYTQITSITLRLTIEAAPGGPNTVELSQPIDGNGDWVEGFSDGTAEAGSSSWANKLEPGTPWAGGAGLGSTGFGPLLASASFAVLQTGTLDLTILDSSTATALIDDFSSGANEGFLLKAQDEAFGVPRRDIIFFSSDAFGPLANRPLLIVDYTPVPEPSTALLLLAGATALAASRSARRRAT